jgi:glutaredoxin 3
VLQVYSKNNCAFCQKAKNYLTGKNIEFEEINIELDPSAREFILSEGHKSVPQIYLKGKLFVQGGFNGLIKLTDDQLKEKLNDAVNGI